MIHQFNAPQTIIHGTGASKELLNQVKRLGSKRVLFVTDTFIESTGLIQKLAQPLLDESISIAVFSAVQPDPTVQNVQAGLKLLHAHNADAIVAVGGGSPIDAAKAMSILTSNPEPLSQYMGYHKISKAGLPLIALPTTAGTGSEATKVTVITDTEKDVKMMILDSHLMPTISLVDYELSVSMPPSLTAYVGVDTLTHGIEAYVSKKANAIKRCKAYVLLYINIILRK
jgi:alcohol dehydrogenase